MDGLMLSSLAKDFEEGVKEYAGSRNIPAQETSLFAATMAVGQPPQVRLFAIPCRRVSDHPREHDNPWYAEN